jgi:UDP-N-acetylmuramyl pentapeptide phosphotransferase/UDP-N-acetylglucosamine-1-phosphate transferase
MTGILDSGPSLHNPNVQRGRSPMWGGVVIVLAILAVLIVIWYLEVT